MQIGIVGLRHICCGRKGDALYLQSIFLVINLLLGSVVLSPLHRPTAADKFSRRELPCLTHWDIWLQVPYGGRQDARLEPKYIH
jgi:hypothetical protein